MSDTNGGYILGQYELIDTQDNDCHDTGTWQEMRMEARTRNADYGYQRFTVQLAGHSDEHFTEVVRPITLQTRKLVTDAEVERSHLTSLLKRLTGKA